MKRLRDRYNKRRDGQPYVLDAMTRDNGKAMYRRNDGCYEVIKIQHSVGDYAYEYYPSFESLGSTLFLFDNAKKALEFYSALVIKHIPTEKELLGEEDYDYSDDFASGGYVTNDNVSYNIISDNAGSRQLDWASISSASATATSAMREVINNATIDELQEYVTNHIDR